MYRSVLEMIGFKLTIHFLSNLCQVNLKFILILLGPGYYNNEANQVELSPKIKNTYNSIFNSKVPKLLPNKIQYFDENASLDREAKSQK